LIAAWKSGQSSERRAIGPTDETRLFNWSRLPIAVWLLLSAGLALLSFLAVWLLEHSSAANTEPSDNMHDFHILSPMLYARALGVAAMVLTVLQWAPQIWTLFRTKQVGALSLGMLALQVPGSYLALLFQLLAHSDPSTWGPYAISALELTVVAGQCIFYRRRNHIDLTLPESDTTPLLIN
jgi:uncharacterized protein with PQ loop repeat